MDDMTELTDHPYPRWIRHGMKSGWIGLYEKGLLNFLSREYGPLPDAVAAAALFVTLFMKSGHVCLPLNRSAGEWVALLDLEDAGVEKDLSLDYSELLDHPAFGTGDESTPFVLEGDHLFIRKYRMKEIRVAANLRRMSAREFTDYDPVKADDALSKMFPEEGNPEPGRQKELERFPEEGSSEPDWQKAAAIMALRKQLLIISGGPGTGKTTTIAQVIQLLSSAITTPLRIGLAAPTGKAAARMTQALNNSLTDVSPTLQESLPGEAKTLHRLLRNTVENGILPTADRQELPFDLVIVDEASMADLTMMDRLLRHLGEHTRLILSGDKDQLSSVEAGAVLGDICSKERNQFNPVTAAFLADYGISGDIEITDQPDLSDSIIYLTRSYRFDRDSGVSNLAEAVNRGDSSSSEKILKKKAFSDLDLITFSYRKEDLEMLFESASEALSGTMNLKGSELIRYWSRSVWLGVLRRGAYGTDSLNRRIEEYLLKKRIISPADGWYHGRPVIITRNDYHLKVFNGNLGVCVKSQAGYYSVLFPGSDSGEGVREIAVHRLRDYKPAYLLTVHKSQGSEFDSVNLLLPPQDSLILTRELIYTAITRARKNFRVYGEAELLKRAVERKTARFTGMKSRLYSEG